MRAIPICPALEKEESVWKIRALFPENPSSFAEKKEAAPFSKNKATAAGIKSVVDVSGT